jgi:hypothetical protein
LKPTLEEHLAALPRLNRANTYATAIPCKVCGQPAPFFDVVDFNKCVGFYCFGPAGVTVHYHRCDACGFLFTTFFDDWTQASFHRYIYNDDYALVDPEYAGNRPTRVAEHLAQLLEGRKDARILDYGAGGGVFAKRMVELGFRHVESYDPLSLPSKPTGRFDIIICNEVIEHIPSPLRALEDMRSLMMDHSCIILGETLQPHDINIVRANWWYVAPRNGHVSIFADRTLTMLAEQFGMIFHRGSGYHILRTSNPGPLSQLAQRFGPAMSCFRLHAPAERSAIGYHGLEGEPDQRFRWSAASALTWRVAVPQGSQRLVQVSIPYVHESRRGFASASQIDIGGKRGSVSIRGRTIVAEANEVAPGSIPVTLRTPELTTPQHDMRQLGLAITAAYVTPGVRG